MNTEMLDLLGPIVLTFLAGVACGGVVGYYAALVKLLHDFHFHILD
jgi:hypothetical protein